MVHGNDRIALVLAVLLSILLLSSSAVACSCDYPDIGFLANDSVEVPANAMGLLWAGVLSSRGITEFPPVENFSIEQEQASAWVAIPVQMHLYRDVRGASDSVYDILVVGPGDGLVAGGRYRFVFVARPGRPLGSPLKSAALDSQVVTVAVSVDEFSGGFEVRKAGPAQAGQLHVSAGSQCTVSVEARWVDIDHILPPDLRKWEDSLFYTVMNGDHYWHPRTDLCQMLPPGRSGLGIGKARLYHLAGC